MHQLRSNNIEITSCLEQIPDSRTIVMLVDLLFLFPRQPLKKNCNGQRIFMSQNVRSIIFTPGDVCAICERNLPHQPLLLSSPQQLYGPKQTLSSIFCIQNQLLALLCSLALRLFCGSPVYIQWHLRIHSPLSPKYKVTGIMAGLRNWGGGNSNFMIVNYEHTHEIQVNNTCLYLP